jgi:ADP-ribose pyrophosphatase YjhB (NUDIX family)
MHIYNKPIMTEVIIRQCLQDLSHDELMLLTLYLSHGKHKMAKMDDESFIEEELIDKGTASVTPSPILGDNHRRDAEAPAGLLPTPPPSKYIPPNKRITTITQPVGSSGNSERWTTTVGNKNTSHPGFNTPSTSRRRGAGAPRAPTFERTSKHQTPYNTATPPIFPYRSESVGCDIENSSYWSPEEKKKWREDHQESTSRCQTVVYEGSTIDDADVLMIRSKECVLEKSIGQQLQILGFPKGHLKLTGDSIPSCAVRELREETCLDLSNLREGVDYVIKTGRNIPRNTLFVKLLTNAAKAMTGFDKCTDAVDEVSEIAWLKLKDVKEAMEKTPWQFNKLSKDTVKHLVRNQTFW